MIKSAHVTGPVSRKAGGLFDAVLRLVQTQHQQGIAVKVFGIRDESTEADLKAWNPVPVEAFKPSWPRQIGYSPRFLGEMQAFAPDISHTHGLWTYSSVAVKNYSRPGKRPYLISPHGMLDSWAMKHSRLKKTIAWRLFEGEHLRGARCLRALCAAEAHSIRELNLKNDIAVIANGVDLPTGSGQSPPPWRDFIEPGRKVLLFLSRVHPKKGLVNLLKAWAKKEKGEDWVLAVAGWDQGGHELELKNLATELGMPWGDIRDSQKRSESTAPPSLLFLGPQFNAAKAACYHHCDAFVLASFSEGLPMVVLEAWANCKPVIMTTECNLPEGFQARAAIRVETSETSITTGINEMCAMTASERTEMGNRAQALVIERFTWTRVSQQLQSVQEWILGGGNKPDCILTA